MPVNTWIGDSSGSSSWGLGGNWSQSDVPDSSDKVTISKAGNYNVVITAADSPDTVKSLTLSGAGNHALTNSGTLSVDGNTAILDNTLRVTAGGTANLGNVRLDNAATIIDEGVINATGTLKGAGGRVNIAGGDLFTNAISGSNIYSISLNGKLDIGTSVSRTTTLSFADSLANTMIFADPGPGVAAHILGFSGNNTIDIPSLAFSSGYTTSYDGTTLSINNGMPRFSRSPTLRTLGCSHWPRMTMAAQLSSRAIVRGPAY